MLKTATTVTCQTILVPYIYLHILYTTFFLKFFNKSYQLLSLSDSVKISVILVLVERLRIS